MYFQTKCMAIFKFSECFIIVKYVLFTVVTQSNIIHDLCELMTLIRQLKPIFIVLILSRGADVKMLSDVSSCMSVNSTCSFIFGIFFFLFIDVIQ